MILPRFRRRAGLLLVAGAAGLIAVASAVGVYLDANGMRLHRTSPVAGSGVLMSNPAGFQSSGVVGEVGGGASTSPAGARLEAGHVPFIPGPPSTGVEDWNALDRPSAEESSKR